MFKGLRDKARCDARGEASREPPRPARCRDALVVVLTLTTGALDAVSYLRLGKVFSSVITGTSRCWVWPRASMMPCWR